MTETTYAARLRYLDATDVNTAATGAALDGMRVEGPDGERIGTVDGFIIDAAARRVPYVVVDAGGWFTSRRLLLPIGHAALSADHHALKTDVTRDALRRLPEFDGDRFRAFTDDELRVFERDTIVACCPDEPLDDVSGDAGRYEDRRHYHEPDWWQGTHYAPEHLRPLDSRIWRDDVAAGTAAVPAAPLRDTYASERMVAHDGTAEAGRASEVSPHFDGRAQPGDVLGIETGGERTGIGDTAEDENTRRRQAEETAGERDAETRRRDR
jgi:hypothetical protein